MLSYVFITLNSLNGLHCLLKCMVYGHSYCSLYADSLEKKLNNLTKISSGLGHLMVLVTFLEWYIFHAYKNENIIERLLGVLWPTFIYYTMSFQVGLNNIKETDFVNVTIQSLMRVTPLRNFFLIPENYQHCKSPLVHRFGELTRKIWHARNFKGQVCFL